MTQFKYLEEVIKIFEKFLFEFSEKLPHTQVIGCNSSEVKMLEATLPPIYKFPAAYKEFLLYGGKEMAGIFHDMECYFSYKEVLKNKGDTGRDYATYLIRTWDPDAELPPDMFLLSTHISAYFEYFRLTEGDNPPVYAWNEEDEGGTEVIEKMHDCFSDYLRDLIRTEAILLIPYITDEKLAAKKPPRGQQFWLPTRTEEIKGITYRNLMRYFGFRLFDDLEKASDMCGLDSCSYLEELSGWKCRKVTEDDSEIRFFPPEGWKS